MSIKKRFNKHKRALLALVTISLFIGSLYVTVFAFSQSTNNTLNLLTNYYLNLPISYPPTNNVNAKDYPIDWQLGSGTIEVIEKNSSGYYNYSDPWIYQYADGKILAQIIHSVQNPNVDYLLVGYRDGWNFYSVSNGTIAPYQDSTKRNYYWIQSPTGTVIVNFTVDQLYTYSGLTFVSGNEPVIYNNGAIITRNGSTLRLQLNNTGPWTNTSTILPGDPQMQCYQRVTTDSSSTIDWASTPFTSGEYNNSRYNDSIVASWEQPAAYGATGLVWNRYCTNLSYFRTQDENTSRSLNNITYYFVGYKYLQAWGIFANLYYKNHSGWYTWGSIGNSEATYSKSITSNFDQVLLGANNDILIYGAGAAAQSYFVWPWFWIFSNTIIYLDQVRVDVNYNWQYTWANLTYHGTPFNTNDYPWLSIRYRTNGTNSWNFWLTNETNSEARLITLSGTSGAWQTLENNITDGNTYNGFHVGAKWNEPNKNEYIEFDYVLTGRRIEVNSFYQDGEPYLYVWGDKSAGQLGTPGYYYSIPEPPYTIYVPANPLHVQGIIIEMDGYANPTSHRLCTLELWKENLNGGKTLVYQADVTDIFDHQIITGTPLVDGNYTVKIKPHWEHSLYKDVEFNFPLYDPSVTITVPASDNTVNTGDIWINGTYNNLPPGWITSITINDDRFKLVEPSGSGPYGYTGTFSFKNSSIGTNEFDVTVTVQDQMGFTGTATRHVIVDQDKPTVEIITPPSDDVPVTPGDVWINGTYNGLGSQITSITIDDNRFIRVVPEPTDSGPYGVTGPFSFKAPNISGSEFDVTVTVQDQVGLVGTATRHVKVNWGQGPLTLNFTVTSFDGTVLQARLWTNHAETRQSLVVLVHGFGSTSELWEKEFNGMRTSLLDLNYTVVAYTQRRGASTPDWVGSFDYLMMDLYKVIDTANDTYGGNPGMIDGSKIGLVGHSLGSYVVTMAACSDLGFLFLKEYFTSLKVVVEGAGPANLYTEAQFLYNSYMDAYNYAKLKYDLWIDRYALIAFFYSQQVTGGQVLFNWIVTNWVLFENALQPIEIGGGVPSDLDNVDTIYTTAFGVYHNHWDTTMPDSNANLLYNDILYDRFHYFQNMAVTGLILYDGYGHLVWASSAAVSSAVTFMSAFL